MTVITRTDIHRPSEMNPAEYTELGVFYQGPNEYIGAAYGSLHSELSRAEQPYTRWTAGNFSRNSTCDHCGAAFHYGVVFAHTPTNETVSVGWQCAQNSLGVSSRSQQARDRAVRIAARQREIDEAVAECPEDVRMALQANRDSATPNSFLSDLYSKLYVKGYKLSDRQCEAVLRSITRDAEWAARKAAEALALVDAPPLVAGRQVIEGVITSAKVKFSQYGESLKMVVQLDSGNKVWGTVPDSIQAHFGYGTDGMIGSRVSIVAEVTVSDNDLHFGFYKRPKNGVVIASA